MCLTGLNMRLFASVVAAFFFVEWIGRIRGNLHNGAAGLICKKPP